MYVLDKIEKQSVEEKVTDTLRHAIVSGVIPLGERLTEINSARQLGVSRGTIRTAFHRLTQEGLLVQTPYTGWTVMTLDPRSVWELYTLRACLETLAARLVVDQISAACGDGAIREALNAALLQLVAACRSHDADDIVAADVKLHKSIITLADHKLLVEQYELIEHRLQIYIRSSDALVAEPGQLLAQHEPFIEVMLGGHTEQAVALLAAHIEDEGDVLVRHLKEREDRDLDVRR